MTDLQQIFREKPFLLRRWSRGWLGDRLNIPTSSPDWNNFSSMKLRGSSIGREFIPLFGLNSYLTEREGNVRFYELARMTRYGASRKYTDFFHSFWADNIIRRCGLKDMNEFYTGRGILIKKSGDSFKPLFLVAVRYDIDVENFNGDYNKYFKVYIDKEFARDDADPKMKKLYRKMKKEMLWTYEEHDIDIIYTNNIERVFFGAVEPPKFSSLKERKEFPKTVASILSVNDEEWLTETVRQGINGRQILLREPQNYLNSDTTRPEAT